MGRGALEPVPDLPRLPLAAVASSSRRAAPVLGLRSAKAFPARHCVVTAAQPSLWPGAVGGNEALGRSKDVAQNGLVIVLFALLSHHFFLNCGTSCF